MFAIALVETQKLTSGLLVLTQIIINSTRGQEGLRPLDKVEEIHNVPLLV